MGRKREYLKYPIESIKITDQEFNNEEEIVKYQNLMKKYKETQDEQIKEKALEIRNEIVLQNIRLVLQNAHIYKIYSRIDIDDLIDAGVISLIKSIENYNINEGFKFSTYATKSIVKEMAIETNTWYGEGSKIYGKYIKRYRQLAIALFGPNKSIYEEENIDYILEVMREEETIPEQSVYEIKLRLLSQQYIDEEEINNIVSEDNYEEEFLDENERLNKIDFIKRYKTQIFRLLSPKEKEVIEYLYGFKGDHPYTQQEIADIYKISRQAIQDYRNKALSKMKKVAESYRNKEQQIYRGR